MSDPRGNDRTSALATAGQESPAESRGRRSRRVRTVDFTRPTKFTKDQQRRLEVAHDTFCQTASTRLSAELRVPIRFELIDVAQLTWANALAEIPDGSVSAVIDVEPFRTRMLLSAEMPLVLSLVERVLGGGVSRRVPGRKFSDVDRALAGHILTKLLDQLSVTWQDLAEAQLTLHELELETGTLRLVSLSEPTLCLSIEARVDRDSSTINLLIPYSSVEPAAGRLDSDAYGSVHGDEATKDRVRDALGGVQVGLRAEVASRSLPAEEVLALRPGDLVRFGVPAAAGVTVFADEVAVYRARPGRSGRRRAVEVVERLEDRA